MLELKNISYEVSDEIDDSKEILRDISLTIDDHFVAITGPNGGGKSTLAKIIAGILTPTSGQIILDGVDITNMSITERANAGISFAFQQPVHFKGLTVKDLICLAAGKNLSINEVCDLLSEVGLCARDYVDRELNGKLSGGELKRIEIAMIRARGTKVSIFDEPEAGIDIWSFEKLVQIFKKFRDKAPERALIVISHQQRLIKQADHIIVLKDGQIALQGHPDKILPKLQEGQA